MKNIADTPLHDGYRFERVAKRFDWTLPILIVSALLPVLAFAGWRALTFAHGQNPERMTFEECMEVGDDMNRLEVDRMSADLQGFILADRYKQRLIRLSELSGQRGDNARALLEKLRR